MTQGGAGQAARGAGRRRARQGTAGHAAAAARGNPTPVPDTGHDEPRPEIAPCRVFQAHRERSFAPLATSASAPGEQARVDRGK